MIAYLKGRTIAKTDRFLILENGGIGYKVYTTEPLLLKTKEGEEAVFYTHHYIKEDALDLYGLETLAELEFFQQLIGISGVGPKSALAVMSMAKLNDIKQAILKGDATLLKKVSGIGQKTAERIVVELKNKLGLLADATGRVNITQAGDEDTFAALEALGFPAATIRNTLQQLPDNIDGSQARIKAALKIINSK
ncbi:MAG: Holliday junction branch migration protein RuvA [Candidatus Komeilibacteria bacterium]|nr:Holliday junction branch migration protein RuvA [Candidatus Komeilibacteria bacterium]